MQLMMAMVAEEKDQRWRANVATTCRLYTQSKLHPELHFRVPGHAYLHAVVLVSTGSVHISGHLQNLDADACELLA
jgi:hypothetical protein